MAAGIVQIAAVAIYVLVMARTLRGVAKATYHGFVYLALGWFLLAAILNPVIFVLFEAPGSSEAFLFNVSSFNIPYRDIQTLGMAVVMILGVSLHILPRAYGFREPSRRWRNYLLWGVNGAILFGVLSFTLGMTTGVH